MVSRQFETVSVSQSPKPFLHVRSTMHLLLYFCRLKNIYNDLPWDGLKDGYMCKGPGKILQDSLNCCSNSSVISFSWCMKNAKLSNYNLKQEPWVNAYYCPCHEKTNTKTSLTENLWLAAGMWHGTFLLYCKMKLPLVEMGREQN